MGEGGSCVKRLRLWYYITTIVKPPRRRTGLRTATTPPLATGDAGCLLYAA